MLCLNKVPVHVKQEPIYTEGDHGRDEQDGELVRRRMLLSAMYDVLPVYGSVAFWRAIEEPGEDVLPLEVLVRCVRTAVSRGDDSGRKRIFEVIFCRLHVTNERWANNVLKTMNLQGVEQSALVCDLYADLCECIMRALMDAGRFFWEGKTEKDTARILGISDRTVRNRLRDAFEVLRNALEPERA